MPTDEPGERIPVAIRDERAEELAISAVGCGPGEDDPPESGHQAAGGGRHSAGGSESRVHLAIAREG